MEPDGQPLTPGTSYGPPPFSSAQNPNPAAVLRSTLESPCPAHPDDDLMSAKCTWDQSGEEGSRQSEGPQTGAEPGRSAQRRFKSSAFPSSLTWDSDSEKETLDEEELLNFSNPHGLAAHSPGSPSSGYRLDSEDDQEPGKLHFHTETGTSSPVEGHSDNSESTKTEEPNICRLGQIELADGEVWNVSDGAKPSLSKVKPKAACQVEEEANTEGGIRSKGKETKQPERDVYTFPGDSDPESPPPAPWAHCTFIQRCRKKRVLLRPFSGLGSSKRTSPETGKLVQLNPPRSKCAEDVKMSRGLDVYDYDESGFGEGAVETLRVGSKAGEGDQEDEGSGVGPGNDIFTCVECSIYFKKQLHLQEHMAEHCQSGRRSGKSGRFRCAECGWNLPTRPALADHSRKHQESRLKILEEIGKLDESEKAQEVARAEPDVTQPAVANPGKTSDSETAKTPPPSVSTPDTEVLGLDATLAKPVRAPGQARSAPACRRRFVCAKCNFSTRTSQALANHSKTHNRKKPVFQAAASPTSSASTSLACGHCAFLTSSEAVLREHQVLVHPGQVSVSETNPSSKSNADAHVSRIPSRSEPPPEAQSDATRGKSHKGTAASEDTTEPEGTPALPTGRDGFKCPGNKRLSARGKAWMDLTKYNKEAEEDGVPGSPGEEQDCHQSRELNFELHPQPGNSPVRGTPQAGAQHTTDASSREQSASFSPPTKKGVKDKEKQGEQQERKVFFLRRSSRVSAAPAQSDSDDDDDDGDDEDIDEERVRYFLSEGLLDEDKDEIDEDSEALRSVERKCPYCPDRFHNGIGLANHVRGHLNRVGVSYNVRHFISPEEVNAIEKKFSYQKKKKKVANFDPDTFSVMHCEFCSAGFDTRAGLSSHARAHLRDFGITNWDVTISPIHILRELFSSRPDLVIPTAPPRSPSCSPGEDQDDDDEEEEEEEKYSQEEGIIEVKLEEETSERDPCASDEGASGSNQSWMKKKGVKNHGGDGKEAAEEEDEDDLSAPDALNSSGNADGSSPEEDADAKEHDLKCEFCDSRFGSRRGLSSHARSHLRQLGVSVSESSGAPIDLLRQIAKERKASPSLSEPPAAASRTRSPPAPPKDEELEDMDVDVKPIPLPVLAKARSSPAPTPSPGASPGPSLPGSPSSVVKKAPISSLLPVSSPLRSLEHKAGGMKSLTSGLSATSTIAAAKPLWAPQENDAPLNLTLEVDPNKDIVCQLCGAWFETRKGLSSHARAHLRHFGVEYSESKGSPIDLLNQLIHTDDFKHKAGALQLDGLPPPVPSPKLPLLTHSSSPSSSSSSSLIYKVTAAGGGSASKATSSSSLPGPPAKRLKASSMQVFRLSSGELMALSHSEPPKEIGCEYCGEYFENRKGLSSHARSHLRQMGITEWSVNGSPIDTLREIIARRGLPCALPLKALKTPPPSSPGPPCSPLSASSSPSATLLGRLPFAFARPSSPPSKSAAAPPPSPSGLTFKPKPEPVQLEVTAPGAVGPPGGFSAEPLNSGWGSSDSVFPLNLAMAHEVEPTRDIRCEFCGEYFENRKGLSSHARSHLRQMGITEWSVNGSPIDTLREVMHKRGAGAPSHSDHGVKKESSRGASSPPWENAGGASSSEGFAVSSFQPSKFRKSPLSLLQSGSKYHKQSLGSLASSAATPAGRFFRISPLGKRPLSEEPPSVETAHTSPHRLKTFSPLPQDFSFKRKPSPDKHGHQDPSCELCGFYFENRKALASHARAHLRQFGVTEWCVNGSPIETLSAWMRSRPQKVLEMHRSYMQGNRSAFKKKAPSSSSSSSSQWSSSLAVSFVRPLSHDIPKIPKTSSKAAGDEAGPSLQAAPGGPGPRSPGLSRLGGGGGLPLQAQVARSELNVRLPRGFERRPLKHPSFPEGAERDSGTPKPPRTGTVPALVPKPPSYPLVKLVGKFYTLKCRFCEVEFHGPLSVQEDWIRHLQQHILKMNYSKPAAPKAGAGPRPPAQASAPASTSTSRTTATPARPAAPDSRPPTPPTECAPAVTATEIARVSEEQPTLIPTPIPLPTQAV